MTKTLTVVGATGTQGSSVVYAALKQKGNWHIRALTRDPESAASLKLRERGVQVVKADLDDKSTLVPAFTGSHAIFAATDFFGPFASLGADIDKAIAVEWTQTVNIIEAALACDTLEHFVWSTLPHVARISNGKYHIGHFEAKNRGEDMIRSHPGLLAKTTFAYVGWYASNFMYPMFKPFWADTADSFVQLAPVSIDVPLYTIGDPQANIGKFVVQALAHPEVTLPGRCVHVAIGETSNAKLLAAWAEVTGKKASYVQTTVESFDALWPGWGMVEGQMFQFYDEFRGKPWAPEGERMVFASELGVDLWEMAGVREALQRLGDQ